MFRVRYFRASKFVYIIKVILVVALPDSYQIVNNRKNEVIEYTPSLKHTKRGVDKVWREVEDGRWKMEVWEV